MTIPELATAINEQSKNYKIGRLQDIRKTIKNKERRAGSLIFDYRTVNKDWAFHYGGRSEIQFNIGIEDEGIRYGLAFSLEPSQALPDVSILYPKILKLNCLIHEQPESFKDYQMWYWQDGHRSKVGLVSQISKAQTQPNTFIFFGKITPYDDVNVELILQDFDQLLEFYKIIEGGDLPTIAIESQKDSGFQFDKKQKKLPQGTSYSSIEKEINVDARHSYIQEILQKRLEKEFMPENVSLENRCRGNKIDVVVRKDDEYFFYEIKVGSTAKSCIRQAMGQLLEYSYGNCEKDASKLFVVGEPKLDKSSKDYLNFLRTEFKIPINYISISG